MLQSTLGPVLRQREALAALQYAPPTWLSCLGLLPCFQPPEQIQSVQLHLRIAALGHTFWAFRPESLVKDGKRRLEVATFCVQESQVPPTMSVQKRVQVLLGPGFAALLHERHGIVQAAHPLEVERVCQAVVQPGIRPKLLLEAKAFPSDALRLLVLALLLQGKGPHPMQVLRRGGRLGTVCCRLYNRQHPGTIPQNQAHDVPTLYCKQVAGVP
mmetsp:Transcript_41902/g.99773  ORF Transcript_41902/g.99773 Transcript_41902/m.99773 type:complete len:214 (-) Transcript_41902:417-1058(-)